jgi:uncharacterized protein YndB with AHSA1/START domain
MSGHPPTAARLPFSIRRVIEAPAAEVFAAWLDPDAVARWFPQGRGWIAPRSTVSIDAQPGGAWLVTVIDAARVEHPTAFVIREISRPDRLVFATSAPVVSSDPDLASATVSFTQLGPQTCLVFQAWADASDVGEVATGWSSRLDHLATVLAQHPSPNNSHQQEAADARDDVHP